MRLQARQGRARSLSKSNAVQVRSNSISPSDAIVVRRALHRRSAVSAQEGHSVDEAVVRRAQKGEQEAFETIVDASIDRLFALATLMTRDRSLAEDAVQDALIRAWRDLPRLREPARISAWLARLTVNATYDLLRRQRRIREIHPLRDDSAISADQAPAAIDRALLASAYGRLPPEQRAVVVLHYYLGLSLDEAATTLSIPPGTARSRLHAGLSAMRRWIGTDAAAPSSGRREALR
jgi:RNA polymerase sigma-70 factor, ECF subfamily